MIIVSLKGGLGNQMFQYAAGIGLAQHLNTKVKFDLSSFKKNEKRPFALENFQLNIEVLTAIEKTKLFLLKKIGLSKWKFYLEKHVSFNDKFHSFPNNVYLSGYFQSEKYFENVQSKIRNDFSFPNLGVMEENDIERFNSVSVHIRRGDYLENSDTFETHGICSLNYYFKALEIIRSKVKNPIFYIFTDDIDWVKTHFNLRGFQFISGNQFSDFEELGMMSMCRHNIIANSTFSWWAAWLNKNQNKIVIAPQLWFANEKHQINDVIPDNWIKIANN